jgi:hypothetical protein
VLGKRLYSSIYCSNRAKVRLVGKKPKDIIIIFSNNKGDSSREFLISSANRNSAKEEDNKLSL